MTTAMRVTVTGASGFIGRRLLPRLEAAGHNLHLVGRAPKAGRPAGAQFSAWDPETGLPPPLAVDCDAIIHLAGEPVDQRWTPEAKRRMRDSRVRGTTNLVDAIRASDRKPSVLISSSAVGFYGDRGDQILTEDASPGDTFLAKVSLEWEAAARAAEAMGIRVVLLRTGIVLGPNGGALAKMTPPFKAGVGGRLGSGKQWMPWIHLDDLVGLICFALDNPKIAGPLNGSAPNPVTNADFSDALGRALHRPAILPVPEFAIRLLYGEMAEILFHSQRVVPQKAVQSGYEFLHPEVLAALKSVLA